MVNFGSCMCFVFMKRLCEFGEIMVDFGDVVDFLVIYILEVYLMDGWVFKVNYNSLCVMFEVFIYILFDFGLFV